jgi:hypothetical protein
LVALRKEQMFFEAPLILAENIVGSPVIIWTRNNMLSLRSKRWADDAGVFSREGKMGKKPYRPRGEDGILYAHKKYKGEHLQDCLDTIDENIADRRVLQLMIDVDEGRYQPGKKVVSAKNRSELTKPGAEEPKVYTDCIAKYFESLDKDRKKGIVSDAYYENELYLCNKHIIRSKVFEGMTISEIREIDPKTGGVATSAIYQPD